jgi:long-subunit acyl-CoA synthetase (AMP-forming)
MITDTYTLLLSLVMTITNPYDSEQSIIEHHKAFINYISALAKLHSDRVMARYCFNGEFKPLTYAEVDRISTNLACTWASNLQEVEVVSFISEHSISFMITMLALLKLRVTMFAVSPRSSEAAIVHMLEKTQSKLLISNVKYESISKSAAAQIDGVKVITVQPLDIETLLQEPLHAGFETILDFNFTKDDIEKTAIIIHR